ncbi:hypothetical protein BOO69_16490 [Sulfitobacter alexandrii]|uniref:Uncharacterized protein n=1 Tax=Sulfitobacter alexandrii TaxID=1917485 RepID=A0A1J0WKH1_9RHOB|nr:hypothetical protein [Sulfitobacter alexandrii]APE44818.1 hypothetical protein BOO69_16490 [Sulfitobacter alexandrii]
MSENSVRRIQLVCFALSHIPLLTLGVIMGANGFEGDGLVLGAALGATVVTAVLLTGYLGRALRQDYIQA